MKRQVETFFYALVGAGAIIACYELIIRPAVSGLLRLLG